MRKVAFYLIGITVVLGALLYVLARTFCLTTDNVINILGFILTLEGLLVIIFQLRIDLNQNKRQVAHDFIHGPVTETLEKHEEELRNLLHKDTLYFETGETLSDYLQRTPVRDDDNQVKETVKKILNFYERMAIGIFKNTLDEDICYDDKGFVFLSLYRWARTYIEARRVEVREPRIWANVSGLAKRWENRYHRDVGQSSMRGSNDAQIIRGRDIL